MNGKFFILSIIYIILSPNIDICLQWAIYTKACTTRPLVHACAEAGKLLALPIFFTSF